MSSVSAREGKSPRCFRRGRDRRAANYDQEFVTLLEVVVQLQNRGSRAAARSSVDDEG